MRIFPIIFLLAVVSLVAVSSAVPIKVYILKEREPIKGTLIVWLIFKNVSKDHYILHINLMRIDNECCTINTAMNNSFVMAVKSLDGKLMVSDLVKIKDKEIYLFLSKNITITYDSESSELISYILNNICQLIILSMRNKVKSGFIMEIKARGGGLNVKYFKNLKPGELISYTYNISASVSIFPETERKVSEVKEKPGDILYKILISLVVAIAAAILVVVAKRRVSIRLSNTNPLSPYSVQS